VDVEVLPPEVQQQGTDAFERIGEDVTETVERRPRLAGRRAYAQAEIRAQGPRAE
jgi:hypothetical protein